MGSKAVLWQHRYLASLVVVYVVIGLWLVQRYGVSAETGALGAMVGHFLKKVPQIIIFVLLWRVLHHTYVVRSADRFLAVKGDVLGFLSDRDRLLGGAIAAGLMTVVLVVFAQIKTLVPIIHPFSWDVQFMELDRFLHFGHDPYALLHAFFGWNLSLTFFTGMYNVWLIVVYVALYTTCFARPFSMLRMQFLMSFLLVWALGGNLLAIVFSSAGPPYYALLGLGDVFDPLSKQLEAHAATGAVTVVDTQRLLWDFYSQSGSLNAISAFPSMHVASSVLIALLAVRLSRWAGCAALAFAVIILIGSVLLGWHYAADSYAGALIAVGVWKAVGWLLRMPDRKAALRLEEGA